MNTLPLRLAGLFFVSLSLIFPAPLVRAADDGLVQMVIGLLHEQDKEMRALALEQVRSALKGEAATQTLAAELPKLSTESQVGLLSALADRGDPSARPAVLKAISDSGDPEVQAAAIRALGYLGESADATRLIRFVKTGSTAVKAAATESLIQLRGESIHATIFAAAKQEPPSVAAALIDILVTRRALDMIPGLLVAAADADAVVRAAAMNALRELASPEHVPSMLRGVLRAERGREREAAEKAVALVCGRAADPASRAEPLLNAIKELGEQDRIAILPTLGRVGGPIALNVVEGAIRDSDDARHEAGLRAICNWPDSLVADRLGQLAATDPHTGHRLAAIRALIRIAPLPDGRTDAEKLRLLKRSMDLCTRDTERLLVLTRAHAIRTMDTLRFLITFLDQPSYAQQACQSIVELAHHRDLREPNKAEFDRVLDRVIQISQDATVVDRANRYMKGETWARGR